MPKHKDYTGYKFGRLTVIELVHMNPAKWRCFCDCGRETVASTGSLQSGKVASCGCYRAELGLERVKSEKLTEHRDEYTQRDQKDGTRLTCISDNRAMRSDNTSGARGVSWSNDRQKWTAELRLKGAFYHLGRYDKLEDAIKARKLAEEKYFEPIIEKYKKEAGA